MKHIEEVCRDAFPENYAVPEPKLVLLQDWNEKPFGAAWHSWAMSCKPWKIRDALAKPFPDTELYVCGEAVSSEQGWIEGGLRSAELLQRFECSKPPWLQAADGILRNTPYGDFQTYITW